MANATSPASARGSHTAARPTGPAPAPPPAIAAAPQTMTRRTARFAKFAQYLEDACAARGIHLDATAIDDILNNQITRTATIYGISSRAVLRDLRSASIGPLADDLVRHAELAQFLHDACTARGIHLDTTAIDEILDNHIAQVATTKRISDRTALRDIQRHDLGPLADDITRLTAYLDTTADSAHPAQARTTLRPHA